MKPLRVCLIMTADVWAGAEVQVATTAAYIAEQRDVTLAALLFNDGWLARELRRLPIEVAVVDERRHNAFQIVMLLTRFLKARRIDLVHTHRYKDNVLGSAAATLAGVPHVIRTVHGVSERMRGWDRMKDRLYDAIDKATLRACADRIVGVSEHTAQTMKQTCGKSDLVTCIRNGIDLDAVKATRPSADVRRALGIDPDAFLAGTAGRLAPVKGHEHFVRAAARIVRARRDARFLVVGSGPLERELRALARSLDVDRACLFVDPAVDRRAGVYDLMAALDVFVLPSLSEGTPMALLEAMALGTPVVASAVGGVPEVITDRATGILVAPRDDQALAAACLELAQNRLWAEMLAAAARRRVETAFTSARTGEALLGLYRDVARSGDREATRSVTAAALVAAPLRMVASKVWRTVTQAIERRRIGRIRRHPAAVIRQLAAARRILVVCHGNIIRSPFAAGLIARALGNRPRVSIDSAGLDAEAGRPPHPLAMRAADPLRGDLSHHAASRLTRERVARADAIFVMDVPQLLAIRRAFPDAARKTFLLTCLAADVPLEVRDPVNGDAPLFQSCYEHISRAVGPLVQVLATERP